jgi:hypothetical protein
MPYDYEKVIGSLTELKELHDDNDDQQEKYAAGLNIIMQIGLYVEKLQPIYGKINQLKVRRPDLPLKRQNVQYACKYYLTNLGFDFDDGRMEGEIGCLVRVKHKNAKELCTLFIEKQVDTGDLRLKWSSALMGGFVPFKHENLELQIKMQTAVVSIEQCICKFNHLHIKTEEE